MFVLGSGLCVPLPHRLPPCLLHVCPLPRFLLTLLEPRAPSYCPQEAPSSLWDALAAPSRSRGRAGPSGPSTVSFSFILARWDRGDVPTHSPTRSPSLPVAKQRLQGSRHVQRCVWRASAAGAGSCACASGRAPASSLLGSPSLAQQPRAPLLSCHVQRRGPGSCFVRPTARVSVFRCFVI